MSRDKFLAALATACSGRSFTCPNTGLVVNVRAPSYHEKALAHAAVDRAWREAGRDVTAVNLAAYQDERDFEVLVSVASIDGEQLGRDALQLLTEEAIEFYMDQMRLVTDDATVEVQDTEVDRFLDDLKKKPENAAETLNTFGFAKLRAYVLHMAVRLSS